jgi:coniferyl-aldehyde dehydrogenase
MSAATIEAMQQRLESQRRAFAQDSFPTLDKRREWLDRIIDMTAANQQAIIDAANEDFGGRSPVETTMVEVFGTTANARNTKRRLKKWMKTKRVSTAPPFRPGFNRLMPQPVGVVGVISPWNLAYNLSMGPAIAAFAAGNRVMLKPSEITPASAELIRTIVAEHFDADEFDVFPGGPDVAEAFSELKFDHLLYTGSTEIGRRVAQAAARNLVPVTLELGGKSPVIVDPSADMKMTARRLAFAKMFNGGQVCISPDYVLVPRAQRDELARALIAEARQLYPDPTTNLDYCAVVSDRHHERVIGLLDDAKRQDASVLEAAPVDRERGRRVPLQVILDPPADSAVMREEIFGPLLPLISYDEPSDAVNFVNARPRPLALYWFGRDKERRQQVVRDTVSGGVTINDAIWHFAQEDQPFGGVGDSGIGSYHGEAGFRTFSKEKPIYFSPMRPYALAQFHPPYSDRTMKLLSFLRRIV